MTDRGRTPRLSTWSCTSTRELEKKLSELAAQDWARTGGVIEDDLAGYGASPTATLDLVPVPSGGEGARQGQRRVGVEEHPDARRHDFRESRSGRQLDNILEWFDGLDREQVKAVIEFAARAWTHQRRTLMRVLFDQATPVPIRPFLIGHMVRTAGQQHWDTLTNGELLIAAESAGFEVLLSTDKNIR